MHYMEMGEDWNVRFRFTAQILLLIEFHKFFLTFLNLLLHTLYEPKIKTEDILFVTLKGGVRHLEGKNVKVLCV